MTKNIPDVQDLRTIKTVRSTDSKDYNLPGYKPLVKELVPSDVFNLLHVVIRHRETEDIESFKKKYGFWRWRDADIIGEEYRYAYNFESPHAAYLVPLDIQVGERVILEDLIEDYIGEYFTDIPYLLASCAAVWNGEDFDIEYDNVYVNIETREVDRID